MDGPHVPGFGWGFHLLFAAAFLLLWLGIAAGFFWALYFVVRTAVTRGILRADAIRTGAVPPRPVAVPPPAAPAASAERPAAPSRPVDETGTAPTTPLPPDAGIAQTD